jgi:hypothetical protein
MEKNLWISNETELIVNVIKIDDSHVWWEADFFRGIQPTLKNVFYRSMIKKPSEEGQPLNDCVPTIQNKS